MKDIRFWILVSIVAISGFSQGMLLPLIAIIFEQQGMSSSLNGFHATGLYIGILLASPFMEGPLNRFGYKNLIVIGGFIVIASLVAFPLWQTFWFWFALRLLIGIGDHMLHFSTQTWITAISPAHKRGRNLSLYGLFYGLGFAIGPLMTNLLEIHPFLPFFASAGMSLVGWLFVFLLKNEFPEQTNEQESFFGTMKRFRKAWQIAWVSFLPAFGYGFLEASINGNFPVYALRSGIDVSIVSLLIPAFAIGGIAFQLPLGVLSDKYGRRNTFLVILPIGLVAFTLASFVEQYPILLFGCFFIAGMVLGSSFSLGIGYMADLLPANLLAAGNLLSGILFSLGSMTGPYVGGNVIQHFGKGSFFYTVVAVLLFIFIAMISYRQPSLENTVNHSS